MRILAAATALLLLAGCLGGSGGLDGDPPAGAASGFMLAPFLSREAGLDDPVFLTHAGDGSGRLFLVEQKGVVKVWRDGEVLDEPFLDIAAAAPYAKVLAGGERGLLGLAFHPDYEHNGRFFVDYTAPGGDVTLAEYHADPGSDTADPASGTVLLSIEHSENGNHNGGMLAFGPDGMLYMGVGDGGGQGDPPNNAQDLDVLLGKLLRLDVDADCGRSACAPPDNPFVGRGGRGEVWDYGLRNPWRFSFDRDTGELWIGDVGQRQWEEVDVEARGQGGRNYGWSRFEGTHVFREDRSAVGAVGPVAEYHHEEGASHCAITGGYVYRGAAVPALRGTYLFADYCSGFLWTFKGGAKALAHDTELTISSFGEDEAGELYVVDHGGLVQKVVAAR